MNDRNPGSSGVQCPPVRVSGGDVAASLVDLDSSLADALTNVQCDPEATAAQLKSDLDQYLDQHRLGSPPRSLPVVEEDADSSLEILQEHQMSPFSPRYLNASPEQTTWASRHRQQYRSPSRQPGSPRGGICPDEDSDSSLGILNEFQMSPFSPRSLGGSAWPQNAGDSDWDPGTLCSDDMDTVGHFDTCVNSPELEAFLRVPPRPPSPELRVPSPVHVDRPPQLSPPPGAHCAQFNPGLYLHSDREQFDILTQNEMAPGHFLEHEEDPAVFRRFLHVPPRPVIPYGSPSLASPERFSPPVVPTTEYTPPEQALPIVPLDFALRTPPDTGLGFCLLCTPEEGEELPTDCYHLRAHQAACRLPVTDKDYQDYCERFARFSAYDARKVPEHERIFPSREEFESDSRTAYYQEQETTEYRREPRYKYEKRLAMEKEKKRELCSCWTQQPSTSHGQPSASCGPPPPHTETPRSHNVLNTINRRQLFTPTESPPGKMEYEGAIEPRSLMYSGASKFHSPNPSDPVTQFVKSGIEDRFCVVFSSTKHCKYCDMAKAALASVMFPEGDEPFTIDVDLRQDCCAIINVLERLTGSRTLPQVFANGEYIGDGTKLLLMCQSGKLGDHLNEKYYEYLDKMYPSPSFPSPSPQPPSPQHKHESPSAPMIPTSSSAQPSQQLCPPLQTSGLCPQQACPPPQQACPSTEQFCPSPQACSATKQLPTYRNSMTPQPVATLAQTPEAPVSHQRPASTLSTTITTVETTDSGRVLRKTVRFSEETLETPTNLTLTSDERGAFEQMKRNETQEQKLQFQIQKDTTALCRYGTTGRTPKTASCYRPPPPPEEPMQEKKLPPYLPFYGPYLRPPRPSPRTAAAGRLQALERTPPTPPTPKRCVPPKHIRATSAGAPTQRKIQLGSRSSSAHSQPITPLAPVICPQPEPFENQHMSYTQAGPLAEQYSPPNQDEISTCTCPYEYSSQWGPLPYPSSPLSYTQAGPVTDPFIPCDGEVAPSEKSRSGLTRTRGTKTEPVCPRSGQESATPNRSANQLRGITTSGKSQRSFSPLTRGVGVCGSSHTSLRRERGRGSFGIPNVPYRSGIDTSGLLCQPSGRGRGASATLSRPTSGDRISISHSSHRHERGTSGIPRTQRELERDASCISGPSNARQYVASCPQSGQGRVASGIPRTGIPPPHKSRDGEPPLDPTRSEVYTPERSIQLEKKVLDTECRIRRLQNRILDSMIPVDANKSKSSPSLIPQDMMEQIQQSFKNMNRSLSRVRCIVKKREKERIKCGSGPHERPLNQDQNIRPNSV